MHHLGFTNALICLRYIIAIIIITEIIDILIILYGYKNEIITSMIITMKDIPKKALLSIIDEYPFFFTFK